MVDAQWSIRGIQSEIVDQKSLSDCVIASDPSLSFQAAEIKSVFAYTGIFAPSVMAYVDVAFQDGRTTRCFSVSSHKYAQRALDDARSLGIACREDGTINAHFAPTSAPPIGTLYRA